MVLGSVLGGHSGFTMWGASAGLMAILCDDMVSVIMITEIRALSLSLCRWINLDVGQVAQAPNRPTAHVVRAMKDDFWAPTNIMDHREQAVLIPGATTISKCRLYQCYVSVGQWRQHRALPNRVGSTIFATDK